MLTFWFGVECINCGMIGSTSDIMIYQMIYVICLIFHYKIYSRGIFFFNGMVCSFESNDLSCSVSAGMVGRWSDSEVGLNWMLDQVYLGEKKSPVVLEGDRES